MEGYSSSAEATYSQVSDSINYGNEGETSSKGIKRRAEAHKARKSVQAQKNSGENPESLPEIGT